MINLDMRHMMMREYQGYLSLNNQLPRRLMDNEVRFWSDDRGSNPDFGIYF